MYIKLIRTQSPALKSLNVLKCLDLIDIYLDYKYIC